MILMHYERVTANVATTCQALLRMLTSGQQARENAPKLMRVRERSGHEVIQLKQADNPMDRWQI
jgi:hypothetical protein